MGFELGQRSHVGSQSKPGLLDDKVQKGTTENSVLGALYDMYPQREPEAWKRKATKRPLPPRIAPWKIDHNLTHNSLVCPLWLSLWYCIAHFTHARFPCPMPDLSAACSVPESTRIVIATSSPSVLWGLMLNNHGTSSRVSNVVCCGRY